MPWKTMDVHEQRVRFVVAATQRVQPFNALCAEHGISRPTGYLWLQRHRELGVRGVAEHSRKPHRSPRRTASSLEQQVVEMRRRYPDWGARKLRVLLQRQGLSCRTTPFIASCGVTIWCVKSSAALLRGNVLNVAAPTNCGRWTSRGPRVGRSPLDHCR